MPDAGLFGQMPDAATPAPGSCPRPLHLFSFIRLSPCVSEPLPDARRCDAVSGVVSLACLRSNAQMPNLSGQLQDAVALARGRVSRLSLCLQSLRSDARCGDASSEGCVSRLSPNVSECFPRHHAVTPPSRPVPARGRHHPVWFLFAVWGCGWCNLFCMFQQKPHLGVCCGLCASEASSCTSGEARAWK